MMRLVLVVLLSFGVLVCGSGCSSWQVMNPPPSGVPSDDVLPTRVRVHLRNYTVFVVYEPRIARDSLFGMRDAPPDVTPSQKWSEAPRESCAIALKDIRTIDARKVDKGGTVALLLPVAIVVVLAIWFFVSVATDDY